MTRRRASLLLAAWMFTHAIATTWWMREQGFLVRPAPPEAAALRLVAFELGETLRDRGLGAFLHATFVEPGTHTRLIPAVAAIFGTMSGDRACNPSTLWAVNVFFGAFFAWGAYRLCRRFAPRGASLVGVVLATTTPIALAYERSFYGQFPMAALLAPAAAAVVRVDGFRRPGRSAEFGLFVGLATAAKVIAPAYLVASAAAQLVSGLRADPRRAARGALLAVVVGSLFVGPWLVAGSAGRVVEYAKWAAEPEIPFDAEAPNGRADIGRWTYYPRHFLNNGAGPLLCIVGLASVAYAARRRENRGGKALWGDAAIAYVAVTLGQIAGRSQYFLPFVPHVGALVAAGLATAPTRRARGVLLIGALAAAGANVYASFRPFHRDETAASIGGVQWLGQVDNFGVAAARVLRLEPKRHAEPWPVDAFVGSMIDATPEGPVRFCETDPYLNYGNFAIALRLRGREMRRYMPNQIEPGVFFATNDRVVPPSAVATALASMGLRGEEVAVVDVPGGGAVRLSRARK